MNTIEDQLIRADLVLTSGGVSVGAYDVVKEVLSRLGHGAFEQVAMQPGKPQGFGTIGPDSTPIITLPGNPVSVVRLVRGVRAPGDPADARRRAAEPADGAARSARRRSPRRRQAAVPARLARRRARAGTSCGRSAARARTWSATWRTSNALVVVPEDVTEVADGRRRRGDGARAAPVMTRAGGG